MSQDEALLIAAQHGLTYEVLTALNHGATPESALAECGLL